MKEKNVIVKSNFDASKSAMFVQMASEFPCKVYLKINEKTANAKSIMGMISISILEGMQITVVTDGQKEDEAMSIITNYMQTS